MTDENEVQVAGRITEQEFLKLQMWFLSKRPEMLVVIVPLLGVTMWTMNRFDKDFFFDQFWLAFPIVIVTPLIVIGIIILAIRAAGQKAYQSNQALHERTTYTFTDEGLSMVGQTTSASTRWSNIREAHENEFAFVLLPARQLMIPVPKSFFMDEEQMDDFRDLLRRNLGEKAKLLS